METLSNSTIINVTAKENRKLEIKVGISYEADIQKAKRIIEKILREDADTKSDTKENGCVCGRACRQCSDHGLACLGVDRTLLANEMAPESEDKRRI